MFQVLASSWALLLGMLLLMVGNGIQGTLLGIRGGIEGFSTFEMSIVMAGYFAGFLGGSRLAPALIRRVGHVRVFAALGSLISAVLILYPTLADPVAWTIGRVLIGFCFSGVYVTAESWLNNSATNENRGKALSLYMITQMAGIVSAQGLILIADPAGFVLFVIPSVLVSISFAPILLSVSPLPAFETTKPMSLVRLVQSSPTGAVGMFLMGGVFSALFGMASVYGTNAGLSVPQISAFIATIYLGGLFLQYPIGWLSDRMDRRTLILAAAATGGAAAGAAMAMGGGFAALLAAAFVIGGMSNPLYALLIAHTNDYLDRDDMAAASGGLLFINGVGAILGPVLTGWMMGLIGPQGFFLFIAILMLSLAVFTGFRMTQRAPVPVDETGTYSPVLPTASPVAVEVAQEVAIEAQQDGAQARDEDAQRRA
ncbi:MFS transporter [Rhodovulum euryhalinum]|uniref:Putative MFS family arabinose efflux permease n=1 Tax=Rhodovulum euryhalinum TaxID=35805 RepID=A0A4R2KH28_9RHOB|nr:MFS transporter [Rhodovulum euryhalinum]TCO69786.1 putative MFS family arabinose efflux permease [Rhodovulum euryhalinum]